MTILKLKFLDQSIKKTPDVVTVRDPILVQNFTGIEATLRSFDQVQEQRQNSFVAAAVMTT